MHLKCTYCQINGKICPVQQYNLALYDVFVGFDAFGFDLGSVSFSSITIAPRLPPAQETQHFIVCVLCWRTPGCVGCVFNSSLDCGCPSSTYATFNMFTVCGTEVCWAHRQAAGAPTKRTRSHGNTAHNVARFLRYTASGVNLQHFDGFLWHLIEANACVD